MSDGSDEFPRSGCRSKFIFLPYDLYKRYYNLVSVGIEMVLVQTKCSDKHVAVKEHNWGFLSD